mmetsp:Transcript_14832/g.25106  ORF Transcript_14832/g.25106 Transcript_14832/m.25106 type:complete len:243 (+) Transcript_14832:188-916(+)
MPNGQMRAPEELSLREPEGTIHILKARSFGGAGGGDWHPCIPGCGAQRLGAEAYGGGHRGQGALADEGREGAPGRQHRLRRPRQRGARWGRTVDLHHHPPRAHLRGRGDEHGPGSVQAGQAHHRRGPGQRVRLERPIPAKGVWQVRGAGGNAQGLPPHGLHAAPHRLRPRALHAQAAAGGRDRVQPAAQGGELLDGPPAHGARERARGGLRQGRIARSTSMPSRGIQFSSVTSSQGINIKPT